MAFGIWCDFMHRLYIYRVFTIQIDVLIWWFTNLQALPIYLDKMFNQYVAIILSVTFVLFFGEVFYFCSINFHAWFNSKVSIFLLAYYDGNLIFVFLNQVIPQAICTRYGLAVGSNFVWLVRILMIICYPISYPIGKVQSPMESWCLNI